MMLSRNLDRAEVASVRLYTTMSQDRTDQELKMGLWRTPSENLRQP